MFRHSYNTRKRSYKFYDITTHNNLLRQWIEYSQEEIIEKFMRIIPLSVISARKALRMKLKLDECKGIQFPLMYIAMEKAYVERNLNPPKNLFITFQHYLLLVDEGLAEPIRKVYVVDSLAEQSYDMGL